MFGISFGIYDFVPVNAWIESKQLPVQIVAQDEQKMVCVAGSSKFTINLTRNSDKTELRIVPAQDLSVSFKRNSRSLSVRSGSVGDRVMQFGAGFAYSKLNNGLLFGNELVIANGIEVAAYGGANSGGFRIKFSKVNSTAIFERRNVEELSNEENTWVSPRRGFVSLVKSIPKSVILPAQVDDDNAAFFATLIGLCGIRIRPVLEGPLRFVSSQKIVSKMDYFEKQNLPEIIATHVEEEGGQSCWVGFINMSDRPKSMFLSPDEIGLAPEKSYVAADFWQWRYLGHFAGELAVTVPPNGCRLIVLRPYAGRPQILCSVNQILGSVGTVIFDTKNLMITGKLSEKSDFLVSTSGVNGNFLGPNSNLPLRALNHAIQVMGNQLGNWQLKFSKVAKAKVSSKPALTAVAGYPWRVSFLKDVNKEREFIGHYVFKNDQLVGYFADNELFDDDVDPGSLYIYSIVGVTASGDVSMPEKIDARTEWPISYAITALFPIEVEPKDWYPRNGFLANGDRLVDNGQFVIGYGLPENSRVSYKLSRTFESIELKVAGDLRFLSDGEEIKIENGTLDLDQTNILSIESKKGGAIMNARLTAKPRPLALPALSQRGARFLQANHHARLAK